MIRQNKQYEITAGGLTQLIDSTLPAEEHMFYTDKQITLSGDVSIDIDPSGAPFNNNETIIVKWRGSAILNGHKFSVFGRELSVFEALGSLDFEITYLDVYAPLWDVVVKSVSHVNYSDAVEMHTWDGSGDTIDLMPGIDGKTQIYVSAAPITLTGSYVVRVDPSFVPTEDIDICAIYKANATIGANTITIFGINIPAVQALAGNTEVRYVYDLARDTWTATARVLLDDNIYRVLGSSSDTSPTYLDGKVNKSVVVASDKIELDGDVTSPGNGYYYGTDSSGAKGFYPIASNTLLSVDIEIDHSEIISISSVPKELVASPGIGKAIKVVDACASIVGIAGVVTPYVGAIKIITDTANTEQTLLDAVLHSTIDRCSQSTLIALGITTTDTQLIANKALYATATSDPTGGAAGQYIKVKLIYRVIDIP